MRRTLSIALTTVSSAVLAVGFTGTAFAQSQGEVTQDEATQCAQLPEDQRAACIQGQAGKEGTPEEAGELGTLSPAEQAEQRSEGNAIVVTGSRIRRSEFNSPDPIQIINPDLGSKEGKFQTVDLINSSPIAAGSVQITSAISNNFVTNGGEGAQTVSLRGLGAERTLVLLNGRRAGPAGVRGGVTSFDLNTLPASIVSSIEILKTGASSIYGSDAIAGVVNIITKKSTDGIELRGFASVPLKGGAEATSVSATYGKDFGRGHFLVTADYYRQNDLKRRDRDFLDCSQDFLTNLNGDRVDTFDVRTNDFACDGVLHNSIIVGPSRDYSSFFGLPGLRVPNDPFNPDRDLFVLQFQNTNELQQAGCIQLNPLSSANAPSNLYGCNFNNLTTGVLNTYSELERNSDVFSAFKRKTLYADASYELTDNIELFTELLYNNRKTKTDGVQQVSTTQFTGNSPFPQFFNGLPYYFCDPTPVTGDFSCDPNDPGDFLNSEIQGQFLMLPVVLWASKSSTDIDYYRGVLGARGDFGGKGLASNFSWDVHAQYSKSDGTYSQDYARDDSLFTQDYRTRSCVGKVTPVEGLPCIDIDWTDPRVLAGNFNQQERDFLFGVDVGHTKYTQKSAEASISGDLFNLPAGPVGIALGAHIRQDKINDTPGQASLDNNRFNLTSSGITAGKTLSRELFGEIQVPLVRDVPMIQRLTFSAAGRITRVRAERRDGAEDTFGDETYKLGADWQVNDWLRFRGGYGTSFRAPALFELFLENETGFLQQQNVDLCSNRVAKLALEQISTLVFENCTALGIPLTYQAATGGVEVASGGGIGVLKPETSSAKTASIVLTPTFSALPDTRVSLAVDYFDIDVRDEITQLGGTNIVIGCLTSQDVLNEPLCDQITRTPAGQPGEFNITDIFDPYLNVSRQRNRGIDVTGRVVQDVGRMGRLSFLAQMTWQLEDIQDIFGTGTSDVNLNGEVGDPRWVGDFNLTWEKGPWTVLYGLDVIGSADDTEDYINAQGGSLNVPNTLCRTSSFYPGVPGQFTDQQIVNGTRVPVCPDISVKATYYHSLSLTREIGDRFQFTLGMANIFDKKPPRVSNVFSGISTLGNAPAFGTQYDYQGRRVFMAVRGNF